MKASEKNDPTGLKVDDKKDSELKSSIAKRGGNSYYYAHDSKWNEGDAKKFYGDGLIYGGAPTLLEKKESTVKEDDNT